MKMTRQTFHIISAKSIALREQWSKPAKRRPLIVLVYETDLS